MATAVACSQCRTDLQADAKFCHECGAAVTSADRTAEYKQVTVLFADVVHSMDIAATVGSERLRELMSELFDRCAEVVQRYEGTVNQFTGDGVMAVSALRWRWRTTQVEPVWRPWTFRSRPMISLLMRNAETVLTFGCG
jgi:RNA polymerase subunit RPABC4/transcription elongation factor Spt4